MDNIEYIEEEVREDIAVYHGEYSDEDIYELMRTSGISIEDEKEIEIVHSDKNGTPRVDVYRRVKRQVPYKVERVLVTAFPVGSGKSEEIQKQRANAMLHYLSLESKDGSRFEIVEEKDDTGTIISYQVYKVQKTQLQEEKSIVLVEDREKDEDLQSRIGVEDEWELIKQKREELASATSTEEQQAIIDEISRLIEQTESKLSQINTDTTGEDKKAPVAKEKLSDALEKEVTTIDDKIKKLEEEIRELRLKHDSIEQKLRAELEKYENTGLLSAEEQEEQQRKDMKIKLEANKKSAKLLRKIREDEIYLEQLKRRKTVKQKDYKTAEDLDLTVEEYLLIQDTVSRKKVEEALMSQKGLADIYHKPAKERTEEEKDALNKAKEEIFREIHAEREKESVSVLDAIQSLYHLDVKFSKGENPRVISVTAQDKDAISEKIAHSSSKIVKNNDQQKINYTPQEAPKDMTMSTVNDFREKFVLFRDTESNDIYIREYGLERFNLVPTGPSVKINGAICYPISKEDADHIIEDQNNEKSPYIVVSRGIASIQVEEMDSKEAMDSAIYIKELLRYLKENDTSVYRYYVELANHYREDPNYEPPEFEKNNPFLTEEDYHNLIESKEERISQYFASTMRRVIDYHLENYQKEEKQEATLKAELRKGDYFGYGEYYYLVFKYANKEQEEKIFELFEQELIPTYGSHSSRVDHPNGYIMPYLADEEGEITPENTGRVGGTSIPEDILPEFLQRLEDAGVVITIENPELEEEINNILAEAEEAKVKEKSQDKKIDIEEWLENMNNQLENYQNSTPEDSSSDDLEIYQDVDRNNEKYAPDKVLNDYQIEPKSGEYIIEGNPSYRISEEDYARIKADMDSKGQSINLVDVHLDEDKIEDENTLPRGTEKIHIYQDEDNHGAYVIKAALSHFNLNPTSKEVKINDRYCFRISDEDADYIVKNQNNDISPYIVEIVPVHLEKIDTPIENEVAKESDEENDTETKEIILYRDLNDNNQVYASSAVLSFFQIITEGDAVQIENEPCFKIRPEIERNIQRQAEESTNPKITIEYHDIHLKAKKTEDDEEEEIEYIPLLRDVDNNDQLYVSIDTLNKFNITPDTSPENIQGLECYKLIEEQQEIIMETVEKSTKPKLKIKYHDVHLGKKQEKPEEKEAKGEKHYQEIIQELTEGLNSISPKGEKRFHASNISVSQAADEIRTGNWLYNVTGFVPKIVALPIAFFRKIGSKILLTSSQKEDYEELMHRLEELPEEDLEILFRDYRGTNAKADMNLGINTCIAARLRKYVMDKVEQLDEIIKTNYAKLFACLGKIKEITESISSDSLSEEDMNNLTLQRSELIRQGAECAIIIDYARKEGIRLLEGTGLHSFEKDMKEVNSKMSYVGYRFAKQQEGFDHETQELLARFGQGFNDAVAQQDPEAIIDNFMNYEACYLDNIDIVNSILESQEAYNGEVTDLLESFLYGKEPEEEHHYTR